MEAGESTRVLFFAVLRGAHLGPVPFYSNRVFPFDVPSEDHSSLVAADSTLLRSLLGLAVDQYGLEAAGSTLLRSLLDFAADQYGLEAAGFHLAGLLSVQSVARYCLPFVGAMLFDTSLGLGFERSFHWGLSSLFVAKHFLSVVVL